jgi:hypothetical protein
MVTDRSILEQALKSSGSVRQIPAAPCHTWDTMRASTDRTTAKADGNLEWPRFLLPQWPSLRGLFDRKETTTRLNYVAYRQVWVSVGRDCRPHGRPSGRGQPAIKVGREVECMIARPDTISLILRCRKMKREMRTDDPTPHARRLTYARQTHTHPVLHTARRSRFCRLL